MTLHSYFILLTLLNVAMSVCAGSVYLHGTVLNPLPNASENIITLHIQDLGISHTRSKEVHVRQDGSFATYFELEHAQDVWVQYTQRHKILLAPGDSLEMILDGNWNNTTEVYTNIRYGGVAAGKNVVIAEYLKSYMSSKRPFAAKAAEIQAFTSQEYAASVLLEYQRLYRQQLAFVASHVLNPDVKDWMFLELMADYFIDLFEYPELHRMSNGKKDWAVPLEYYNFLEQMPAYDQYMFMNANFSRFVPNNFLHSYVFERVQSHIGSIQEVEIKEIINESVPGNRLFRELVFCELVNHYVQLYGTNIYEEYKQSIIDPEIENLILRRNLFNYYNLGGSYDSGLPVTSMQFKEFQGMSGARAYDQFIRQISGKVTYTDVWATWCAPCKIEMPNTQILKDNVSDEQSEFIYVCLDSDQSSWHREVRKMNLPGTHYFFNKAQSKYVKEQLQMHSYPHYVLYGPSGQIIENGGDMAPSKVSTLTRVKSALQQQY